ncbi:putative oligosaccharide translocation protein RFT1 [Podospora fimiseda]|uniref:Man(5)GlcNAc(2)-PP-dolichol translocation protein RFT1 n=1 Tax=Podospora fimiseda TaxID=252190 RepID=A0AAN7GXU4_9PEZI|nr:putative oligosaccharide translocation protein RFT1 [Podospora fimiseda]
MTTTKDAPTRVMRGASLLILLQVISRAITFIANQVLLRFLTAQLLGISTQLEVYYLSVIFFARESLRVAIQRQDLSSLSNSKDGKTQNHASQAIINLGYIPIILGIPLSVFFAYLYLSSLSSTTLSLAPNLILSLYIYALASILELLSEPIFILTQTRLEFSIRARAESTATFLRCLFTLFSAIYLPNQGVLPFAIGQLTYALTLLIIYLFHGSSLSRSEKNFSLFPRPIPSSPIFHPQTLTLTTSLLTQSVLKHLLTQGDTFLVTILSSPTSQGVYALANNYGGLLARLLFQPIEESSRTYFSRLLSSPNNDKTAAQSLSTLIKLYSLLSVLIVSLGPPAAPLLLSLVAGPQWLASGAGECLSAYMYYIPLLAINGITEAFVSSVATEREVHKQSVWMAGFSAIFAAAGYITLRVLDMGATGLVWANAINMACRILWCWVFISGWFNRNKEAGLSLNEVMPGPLGVGIAAVSGSVVRRVVRSEGVVGVKAVIMELSKVAGVGVVFLVIL